MTDLNGAWMRASHLLRRRALRATGVAVCTAAGGLAACHSDSTSAPKTATTVTVLSGNSQTGTVGSPLSSPVVLQINDQNGKGLVGTPVTLTPGTNAGSVSSSPLTTDANGQVTFTWTLGTVAGTDTIAAQVGSLPVLDVLATAIPDVPASIVVVSGDNQSAPAGTALASPFTVKVLDKYGNAIPNVTVSFTDDANGTFGSATVATDSNGMASDTITLGSTAGTDDITVSVQSSAGPVTVTLHETGS